MRGLIAVAALVACLCAVDFVKKYRHCFLASLRVIVKRIALYIMSFSCISVLATVLMIACYPNICEILKNVLSANTIGGIKNLIRFVFGVDSAFVALHLLAFYSCIASFVSCLILSAGIFIRFAYLTILKVSRTPYVENRQCVEEINQHSMPTFKLYLKYNS